MFGRIPEPFVWGFYDGDEYKIFDNIDDLCEWLAPQRLIVYAHNGGRFDYHYMLDWLEIGDDVTVINGRIAKFKIGECEFRDSWNLLPVSLATMQKDEIDYKIMERDERDKPENRREIENYLRGDCVYLWNWLTAFIDQYGMGLTVAGTALKFWSKRTGQKPPQDKDGVLYHELRPYYHGGRTQCFERAVGEIKREFALADINSAYPYAMLHEHPIGLTRFMGYGTNEWKGLPIGQRRTAMITCEGVARGCFPWRHKDRLYYPDDDYKRTYNITGWEYIAAKETGRIQGQNYRLLLLRSNDDVYRLCYALL